MKNILEMLESNVLYCPDKICFKDQDESITFTQLNTIRKSVGSAILKDVHNNDPVIVFMEQSVQAIEAFMGIVSAGGFYVVFNHELPDERLRTMSDTLQSTLVITDQKNREKAEGIFLNEKIYLIDDLIKQPILEDELQERRQQQIDYDPLYMNFTSGSTGVPKGVLISHRSVIDFIPYFSSLFNITKDDILASQAPFDFDVSVKDIYSTLYSGATLSIVPRNLFTKPAGLLDFLCEEKITTMIWAVSALCLITTFHGLDYKVPTTVNKILFSGEVMPLKHLKAYQEALPEAMFVNLYGPTEVTCNCTYHIIDSKRDYSQGLPIGKAFPNERVLLVKDNQVITQQNVIGEIVVSGSCLSLGYYRLDSKAFSFNPLIHNYHEMAYYTGDLACYNDQNELVFKGRKDFQIKYQGHRIELEEVERAILKTPEIKRVCCLFDGEKEKLICYYIGEKSKKELKLQLMQFLPRYMVPSKLIQIEAFPLNKNGKIDRKKLMEMYKK